MWASALLALVAAGLAVVVARIPLSSDRLRREVVNSLSARLEARVELRELELHPFPRLSIVGRGLAIYHRRRPEQPLIQVEQFTVAGDLVGLLRKHVAQVNLAGLAIAVAPERVSSSAESQTPAAAPPANRARGQLVIDRLVADGATLTIIPRDGGKRPRVWALHELEMWDVGLGRAMPFRSLLTNAVPPGQIETAGTFGPWRADDPGLTPLTGEFTFDRADLSVFKGIAGILSAKGTYDGVLGRIEAQGQTKTPDFTVSVGGHPLPLDADYRAVIDGTNGNTTLEWIEARFLQTVVQASGGVFDVPDVKGRQVMLDVGIDKGRLEDVLRLAVPTPAPTMSGALRLQTRFLLPPGDVSVVDKLALDGTFSINDGRFTDRAVQQKINTLSGKARVDEGPASGSVSSDFTGRFQLGGGRLTLNPLRFNVPGALVEMSGSYSLRSERLAFAGQMLMDARVSQTIDGWKSLLVKPFDPLFRKAGRTFIPLRIGGTRREPTFGVDMKRVFNKKPGAPPPRLASPTGAAPKTP